jgi:flagellar motility protein MotE (MotC chaperone)
VSSKEYGGLLLRMLTKLERVAAVLFLAVLAAVAALYFAKRLDRERARSVWGILSGQQVAVTLDDRGRLADYDKQAASGSDVEKQEQEASGQVRQEIEKRKEQLSAEFKREHEFLKLLSDQLKVDQRKVNEDSKQLADAKEKLALAQKALQYKKDDIQLTKVLKLYAGMDAEIIAADFEEKLKAGSNYDVKFKEVIEILRRMPERQASEVLSAIEKSDVRNKLMEELRKS